MDDASEASGLTIGLLISYRRGDRQFLCYAPPENGTVLIDRAIDGCEQANQMPYPNEPRVLERFDIDMHSVVGGFLLNSTIDHIALLAPGSVSHRPLSVAVANSSTIMERSGAVTVKEHKRRRRGPGGSRGQGGHRWPRRQRNRRRIFSDHANASTEPCDSHIPNKRRVLHLTRHTE